MQDYNGLFCLFCFLLRFFLVTVTLLFSFNFVSLPAGYHGNRGRTSTKNNK